MAIWRLVSGILSMVMFLIISFQSCAVGFVNAVEDNEKDTSGAGGIFVAFILLVAGIVSVCLRKNTSKGGDIALIVIFGLAALIGYTNLGTFGDLVIWSSWALLCAVLAVVALVQHSRMVVDDGITSNSRFQQASGKELPESHYCDNCGVQVSTTAKFCPNCGKIINESPQVTNVVYQESYQPADNSQLKKILVAVLGILLLAGLGAGGYFYYKDYSEKKAKEEARLKAEQEEREEQQRLAELDAADWERATVDGTEQGYQRYLQEHADGKHAAEAQEKLDLMEKQRLTDNEVYDVRNVVTTFFYDAAGGDEEGMLSCVSPTMDRFLGKTNATKVDVVSFMRRLHGDDVYAVNISLDADDIQVSKSLDEDGMPVYTADFAYDQRLEREDTSQETFASMKGHAVLNQNFKMTTLTLNKLSSY